MSATSIKIPAELFALAESSRFEGTYDLEQLKIGPDEYRFPAALTWAVNVTNTGSAFLLEGEVVGAGECECSRCLEPVVFDFEGRVEGYFVFGDDIGEQYDGDDEEIGADEFDALPDDHIIDLEPLLNAALIVDAPQMPLCNEDCAGLCSRCGANLNKGACACGPDEELEAFERQSNPFSALADFKFD